jgi:hypothetical protein
LEFMLENALIQAKNFLSTYINEYYQGVV